jgi:hypothetical protein
MGFTALALISAGLLLGQANTTSAQQPARPPVVWVQPGYYNLNYARTECRAPDLMRCD